MPERGAGRPGRARGGRDGDGAAIGGPVVGDQRELVVGDVSRHCEDVVGRLHGRSREVAARDVERHRSGGDVPLRPVARQLLLGGVVVGHDLGGTAGVGDERLELPPTDADAVLRQARHLVGGPQLRHLQRGGHLELVDAHLDLLQVAQVGEGVALRVVVGRGGGGRGLVDRSPLDGAGHVDRPVSGLGAVGRTGHREHRRGGLDRLRAPVGALARYQAEVSLRAVPDATRWRRRTGGPGVVAPGTGWNRRPGRRWAPARRPRSPRRRR